MVLLVLAFLFDFLPNGALYYCHFRATKHSYDQTKLTTHGGHRTSSKIRTTDKERAVVGQAILEVLPEISNDSNKLSDQIGSISTSQEFMPRTFSEDQRSLLLNEHAKK